MILKRASKAMQHSLLLSSSTGKFVSFISLGIFVLMLSIFLYPSFLPVTISDSRLKYIEMMVYAFYLLFICGLLSVGYGTHALIFNLSKNILSSETKTSSKLHFVPTLFLIFRIAVKLVTNRRYYRYFWLISVGYGIVYGLVSGLLVFHQNGFAAEYGVNIPSITSVPYGPTGYVPALAIYITDHFGLFVVPINLLVITIISTLVGFNGILMIFTVNQQRKRRSVARSRSYSFANSLVGATLGLFAACPTCASFYVFAALAGSLAPSIAAFTVAFYTLFLGISVPLLVGSSLIVLYGISKAENMYACKF